MPILILDEAEKKTVCARTGYEAECAYRTTLGHAGPLTWSQLSDEERASQYAKLASALEGKKRPAIGDTVVGLYWRTVRATAEALDLKIGTYR